MDTKWILFINSKKSKKSNSYRLLHNFKYEIDLKRSEKYVALLNISIYYTWKNIKKLYKNIKFKI